MTRRAQPKRQPSMLGASLLLGLCACAPSAPAGSDSPGAEQTLPIVIDVPAQCRGPVSIDPASLAQRFGAAEEDQLVFELYGIPVLMPRDRVAVPDDYASAQATFAEAETLYADRDYAAAGARFVAAAEQFSVDDDSTWAAELEKTLEYTCKNAVLAMWMADDRSAARALADGASDPACRRGAALQVEALAGD